MPRKRGPLYEVTDEWRHQALAVMETLGVTRAKLAKELRVHKSSVTVLFRMSTDKPPGPITSTLAKPVADFLKVPLPSQISDGAEADHALRLFRAARERNPTRFQHVLALLEDMAGLDVVSTPTKKSKK